MPDRITIKRVRELAGNVSMALVARGLMDADAELRLEQIPCWSRYRLRCIKRHSSYEAGKLTPLLTNESLSSREAWLVLQTMWDVIHPLPKVAQ